MRRVVVVGGSLAAVHAAEALRERDFDGEITIISAEQHLPYDRPPLSKEALSSGVDVEKLYLRSPQWYEDHAIDVRLGAAAAGLDVTNTVVHLADGTEVPYEGLVLATGSRARRLPVVSGLPDAHVVRDIGDAAELREKLRPGKRLLLVGAGFIGLEIAATARQMGVDVSVIEVGRAPLARALGDEVGAWFRDLHTRNGIDIVCTCSVERFEATRGGVRAELSTGDVLDADIVVGGIGATPNVEWLEGSGLSVANGVLTGADLSTGVPGVVAAGDIARWYNPLFDEEMRVEHWTNAVEQGRHAAHTLLGTSEAYSSVPYFWSDQFTAKMRFVGTGIAATDVVVEDATDTRLTALYGRDGVIRGAVAVNAPRQLVKYRTAIRDQVPWQEIAPAAISAVR
ncbi:NAD(P)/FAD-dependent oxidoreductase [Georgenia sp. Z1344]|uniref:NAD(P)/FAD-dependent oxidoreductase n=1 Tax=Georgenia sp. Z1344 TaxID=3416706 RepID=UPI003CF5ABD5